MVHLGLPLLEQRDSMVLYSVSLKDQELCTVRAFLLILPRLKVLTLNFSYYSLISLQIPDFPEDPDQTRPDQTRLAGPD